MMITRTLCSGLLVVVTAAVTATCAPAAAQQQQKSNILFIMGDDIGWMQPSIYHQGLMVIDPNVWSGRALQENFHRGPQGGRYWTNSKSPGFHVLLNQGSSGPYRRSTTFQPFRGIV